MERLMISIRVLAFSALAVCGLTVTADTCTYYQYYQYYQYPELYVVCEAQYYAWTYQEPDWFLYQTGDEVLILYVDLQPVAWYVTPVSDPGRDADHYVINEGGWCGVQPYPW